MYALVESRENGGLYRSEDAGASWRLVNREQRIYGREPVVAWYRGAQESMGPDVRLEEIIDGRKLRFAVDVVSADGRTIGVGTHERRIVQGLPR